MNFIKIIKKKYRKKNFVKEWKKRNSHNSTYPVNIFKIDNVKVGRKSYGPLEVYSWDNENEKLIIGSFCSIAKNVKFILGGNHNYLKLTTYPIQLEYSNTKIPGETKGPIIIESDVWIGYGATILSGLTIGQGAVIGAMSVVTKNVYPYTIVAGNPAKIINYRFNEDIINELLSLNIFEKITDEFILGNLSFFNQELTIEQVNALKIELIQLSHNK